MKIFWFYSLHQNYIKMSLVRSASAINWAKETSFNPADSIPILPYRKREYLLSLLVKVLLIIVVIKMSTFIALKKKILCKHYILLP